MIGMSDRHEVIHSVPVHQQVVRDDPAMASPPHRFRTHQCQPPIFAKLD
jgi:hypothetical protein